MKGWQDPLRTVRAAFHIGVLVYGAAYVCLVPFGLVARDNRWTTEEIVLFGVLILLSSQLLESLAELTIGKGGVAAKFRHLEGRQSELQQQIRSLQVAVQGVVTQYEFDKLVGLNQEDGFPCRYSDDLYEECKQLRAKGLIMHHEGTGLADMQRQYGAHREIDYDLRRFFKITPQGLEYLKLRADVMRAGAVTAPAGD